MRDSDGTLIFTSSYKLSRGPAKTAFFAERYGKPFLHVHLGLSYQPAVDVLRFVYDHNIKVLNIAGTRGSKEPYIGKFVKKVLEEAFSPRPHGWLGGTGED